MCSEEEDEQAEATASQIESCVSSVACDVGRVDNLQELGPCYGTNHTLLARSRSVKSLGEKIQ